MADSVTDLPVDDLTGLTGIALGEHLPHTNDRMQAGVYGGAGLLLDTLIGLTKKLAAFRVSDNRVGATGIDQHTRGNLTGECTFIFPVDVLRGDRNACAVGFFRGGDQSGKRRS